MGLPSGFIEWLATGGQDHINHPNHMHERRRLKLSDRKGGHHLFTFEPGATEASEMIHIPRGKSSGYVVPVGYWDFDENLDKIANRQPPNA